MNVKPVAIHCIILEPLFEYFQEGRLKFKPCKFRTPALGMLIVIKLNLISL